MTFVSGSGIQAGPILTAGWRVEVDEMNQRARDGVALVVVIADLATYVALLSLGSVGFIGDPRAMASIGMISSVLLCPMSSRAVEGGLWVGLISVLGAATLAFGIATLVSDSWVTLAFFMAAIAAMWVASATRHMVVPEPALSPRTRQPAIGR